MQAPRTILRWETQSSNWKRHQRRYVRPIILEYLRVAHEGLGEFGISNPLGSVCLFRGVNTNQAYAFADHSEAAFDLYVPVDDIRYKKLLAKRDLWVQVIFHESIHAARTQYFANDTILERAATEGLAYCATQLFAASAKMTDGFNAPMDFLATLPLNDLADCRRLLFAAHKRIGDVDINALVATKEFDELVHSPTVDFFSAADVVGICGIASRLSAGHTIRDLIALPAEELLQAS